MASSGTINGNQSGTQPYLRISWSILSQDIPNNRSRVRLQLILVSPYSLHFSSSKTGSNNGSSFTYTGGFSGTGTRTLNTRDIWVNHNSDGTRTQSVNGSFNIQVTWGGSRLNTLSVSGNMNLDTIPRASEVTAFSMGGALQVSTANSVNVRLNVYSTAFRFDVALRYGSTTIASWTNQSFTHNTSKSLSLTASQVNNLLSAMRTVTSGTVTIRVQTKSGSGGSNIGSVQTRNATATVHSNVTPTATGLSISIDGNGRDSAISKYVQNVSRVSASFNATAIGGTYLVTNRIYIRRTDGSNSSTIHGNSGRSGLLTSSGEYEAVAETVDGRGRSATQRITFTVHAYSPPAITTFTADRNSATPTTVNISRAGNFTPLGTGDNTLTILIQISADGGATWTDVQSTSTTTSTFTGTVDSTGNSVTSSYQFRIVITDSFNNSAEATATVTTQRVVLDVHKNEGVGIGKIHEQGVLDIDGDIYANGRLLIVPHKDGSNKSDPIVIRSKDNNGHGYIEFWGADGTRKGIVGIPTNTTEDFEFRNEIGGNTRVIVNRHAVNLSAPNIQANGSEIVATGSNSNGQWVRYYDGTQICWHHGFTSSGNIDNSDGGFFRSANLNWTFPMAFSSHVSVFGTPHSWARWATSNGRSHTVGSFIQWSTQHRAVVDMSVMAIGRWR